MAIEVEEEKKGINWLVAGVVTIIIVVLFVGGYYLFFKKPEIIDVVIPPRFEDLKQLSQAKFEPQKVLDSTSFKALRDYSSPLTLPQAGRANPFKPF